MIGIFKREMKAYFSSPIGYIFLAVMFLLSGYFFTYMLLNQSSYIEYVFSGMMTITMILIPFLTMRLLSEDKKLKTDQLLLTSPVSVGGMVWGKFLAAFTMFLISVSITLVYVVILATFTTPNWNVFVGNFIGLLLFGAALIAIGLFISSLTESQMIAAVISYGAIMFIGFFDTIAASMPSGLSFLATIFSSLSFNSKYTELVSGVLNIANMLFFVSVALIFNFLTVRIIERKRWS